jgi:hypothetical protein
MLYWVWTAREDRHSTYNEASTFPILPFYRKAIYVEWNNTILNLIKKAMGEYQPYLLVLFFRSNIPFNLRANWCSYPLRLCAKLKSAV